MDNGTISDSTANEAGEAEVSNNDWLCPVSVRLKHTFHTNSEDGEKMNEVPGASRMHRGGCSGPSILNVAWNCYEPFLTFPNSENTFLTINKDIQKL